MSIASKAVLSAILLLHAVRRISLIRLGDIIVAEPIAHGSLMPLLAGVHYAEPLRLSALYLEGRHRLLKVRVFLDFLTERFASTPWRIDTAKFATVRARARG